MNCFCCGPSIKVGERARILLRDKRAEHPKVIPFSN